MSVTILVVYPAGEDAKFDKEYYMKTHMPLVMEQWKPYGLQGWKVSEFQGTASGDPPLYSIQALLFFDNLNDFKTAASSDAGPVVMGDIPNFSNKQPVILVGQDLGKDGSQG